MNWENKTAGASTRNCGKIEFHFCEGKRVGVTGRKLCLLAPRRGAARTRTRVSSAKIIPRHKSCPTISHRRPREVKVALRVRPVSVSGLIWSFSDGCTRANAGEGPEEGPGCPERVKRGPRLAFRGGSGRVPEGSKVESRGGSWRGFREGPRRAKRGSREGSGADSLGGSGMRSRGASRSDGSLDRFL